MSETKKKAEVSLGDIFIPFVFLFLSWATFDSMSYHSPAYLLRPEFIIEITASIGMALCVIFIIPHWFIRSRTSKNFASVAVIIGWFLLLFQLMGPAFLILIDGWLSDFLS